MIARIFSQDLLSDLKTHLISVLIDINEKLVWFNKIDNKKV